MRFSRIKVSTTGVELDWTTSDASGTSIEHMLVTPEKPAPAFVTALQAFSGWVVELIGVAQWHDSIRITSLHLSEDSNHRRGLKITAGIKIERAKNQTLTFNTPLMHEAKGGEEGVGTYGELVAEFITAAEAEAARFVGGEREQLDAFAGTTSTTSDESAPAPRTQARAPRGKKNKDFILGVGPIENPDATDVPTDENLRQLLLRAERDVPIDAIAHWNSRDRDAAQRWATAVIRKALGEKPPAAHLEEPACVKKCATLPLSAEDWNEPSPIKPSQVAGSISRTVQ